GLVDLLRPGELAHRCEEVCFQHVAPSMGANQRLDDGTIYSGGRRRPSGRMRGRHDLPATTLAAQRNRNADHHGPAVSAELWPAGVTDADLGGFHYSAACWRGDWDCSSAQSEVSPSIFKAMSTASGLRSIRSTNNSTIRACSAGNSSLQRSS